MRYYLKKLAISGVISTTLFTLLFYFVYAAENAKYGLKTKEADQEKTYAQKTIDDVNAIVIATIEQEIARETESKKIAQAPAIERIVPAPPTSVRTSSSTPKPLDIPLLPPAIEPASITIQNIGSIAIPNIPAPASALSPAAPIRTTAMQAPAPVQPKPAPAPRTTVS